MPYMLINTVTGKAMPRIERINGVAQAVPNSVKMFKHLRQAQAAVTLVSLITKQPHIIHKHGEKYVGETDGDSRATIVP